MSLAGNISSRRLARSQVRTGSAYDLTALQAAFDTALLSAGDDVAALSKLEAHLMDMKVRVFAQKSAAETNAAAVALPPHVTLSTKFVGEAYERSVKAKELLERFGCTVYNPNTDCEEKPGDAVKGASNWLLSFRVNGLQKSKRTRGFVLQLQADARRERSDMQIAEEAMATEVEKHGVPIIGMYGRLVKLEIKYMAIELPKALDIARRQWESGRFEDKAVAVEEHKLGDDGVQWLADYVANVRPIPNPDEIYLNNCQMGDAGLTALAVSLSKGAMAHLEELHLDDNQIGDTGVQALATAATGGALANLKKLWLGNNQIGDAGCTALAKAAGRGALANVIVLNLRRNRIGDPGMIKLSEALATGAMAHLQHLYLDGNQIGDAGIQALTSAAAGGALVQCQQLDLTFNHIGDAGLASLADACAKGALPAIETVVLFGNPASDEAQQALDDVIESRQ